MRYRRAPANSKPQITNVFMLASRCSAALRNFARAECVVLLISGHCQAANPSQSAGENCPSRQESTRRTSNRHLVVERLLRCYNAGIPAKPVVVRPLGQRKVQFKWGSVAADPYSFLSLSLSVRDLHSLHISRTNPDTVAIAAAMKRTFSIIGDHSLQKRSAARAGLCWQGKILSALLTTKAHQAFSNPLIHVIISGLPAKPPNYFSFSCHFFILQRNPTANRGFYSSVVCTTCAL